LNYKECSDRILLHTLAFCVFADLISLQNCVESIQIWQVALKFWRKLEWSCNSLDT